MPDLNNPEVAAIVKSATSATELQAKANYERSLHRAKEIEANREVALKSMEYAHIDNERDRNAGKWVITGFMGFVFLAILLGCALFVYSLERGHYNQFSGVLKELFKVICYAFGGAGAKTWYDSRAGRKNKSDDGFADFE